MQPQLELTGVTLGVEKGGSVNSFGIGKGFSSTSFRIT